jgi:AAA domain
MSSDEWTNLNELREGPMIPLPDFVHDGRVSFAELEAFAAVFEPGVDPLVGDSEQVLLPQGGDAMLYGDGGVGKTTLAIDLAFHLAAGSSWLGIPIMRAARVALVESEGPRPLFRAKLRRKLAAWHGTLPTEGLFVLEQPWGELRFTDEDHRARLAAALREHAIELVIAGPLTSLGMDVAGTLQEVRDFAALVDDVRSRAERPVTFLLVHHENKGGRVSGAWEGVGDTLLHVQSSGHGRARLFVQKARWASEWHAKTLHLLWAEGDSFVVDETGPPKPEAMRAAIEQYVLEHASRDGGCRWRDVLANVKGTTNLLTDQRDALLSEGLIVNHGTGNRFALWHGADPAAPQRFDDSENGSEGRNTLLERALRNAEIPSKHSDSTPSSVVSGKGVSALRPYKGATPLPQRSTDVSEDDW